MSLTQARTRTEPAVRVSTLELFFDLVFVFTVTQLTARFAANISIPELLRIGLLLGIIWWMYAGYAWLTNAVAPTNSWRRGLLVTGMAGFLTIALAVPGAFAGSGWAYGVGYFVVNLVHSGLFMVSGGPGAARAMRRLASLNLTSATLVLVGGFLPEPGRYGVWTAAFALQIASPYLHSIEGFSVSPAHFVERHGLVVIVALGESVVAIGLGVGSHLTGELLLVAVLGLVLAYYLWWAYFGGDDVRAEHALAAIDDALRRARAALAAYGYAHYFLLLGIVIVAAALKKTIGHPFEALHWPAAVALGGGVALFLAGDLAFRRILAIGRPWYRLVGLAVAVVTVPLGLVSAVAQLGVMTAVIVVLLSIEGYRVLHAAG